MTHAEIARFIVERNTETNATEAEIWNTDISPLTSENEEIEEQIHYCFDLRQVQCVF